MKTSLNYPAILVCTILSMLIGMFWYSPMLLGTVWAEAIRIVPEHLNPTAWHFLGAAVVAFVIAWAVALVLSWTRPASLGEAIKIALTIWFGFIATTHFSGVIWAGVPLAVYLINIGCFAIYLIVNSTILYLWRKG